MATDKVNPITGFDIVLLPATPASPKLFGWIQLLNGQDDAGYVYLTDDVVKGRIGSSGYIVTGIALDQANILLTQLRARVPLQIRIGNADSDSPWVFIEPRDIPRPASRLSTLPDEEALRIEAAF